ncbi:MAG: DUF4381 family protein [Betaproteobacteria bacterium]|nr:DUF4381 family protein [Betaproteobacteria bacterium]MDE2153253.1 DUF4381 family protein [Betaproteobacteria bacterium]
MIDRLAALADIVPPRPVAAPPAVSPWQGGAGWWLAVALLLAVLAFGVYAAGRRARQALRRRRARARLLRTLARLRAGPPDAPVAPLLPAVFEDLRRAGLPEPGAGDAAHGPHQGLRYARDAGAAALCNYLDQRLAP